MSPGQRAACALLAVCSSCATPPSAEQSAVDLATYCSLTVDAGLRREVLCGAAFAGEVGTLLVSDFDSCVANHTGLLDGGQRVVASRLRACLDDLATAACTDSPACDGVIVGTAARDEPCLGSAQCVGDLACDSSAQCPGRCAPGTRPIAARDQPCGFIGGVPVGCDGSLHCVGGTCQRLPERLPRGATCVVRPMELEMSDPCELGATCFDGVCLGLGTVGQRCPCQRGLVCDGVACVPPGALPGSSCGVAICRRDHFCRDGACVPRLGVGAACDRRVSDACADDLVCDGVCRPRGGLGESCAGTTAIFPCAALLVCNGSTCQPPTGEGGLCTSIGCAPQLACVFDGRCRFWCAP